MESYQNNYQSNNTNNPPNNTHYDFCKCIKSHYYNSYLLNMNNKTIIQNEENKDKRINIPNFYDQKNKMNINKAFSTSQYVNFYDSFFIKNLALNWMALYNPQNISFNSINRDGCIFTISFNQTGTILASSNHLHNIEIWDMKERKVKKVIKDHEEIVTGIEFFNVPTDNINSQNKNLDDIEKLNENINEDNESNFDSEMNYENDNEIVDKGENEGNLNNLNFL